VAGLYIVEFHVVILP